MGVAGGFFILVNRESILRELLSDLRAHEGGCDQIHEHRGHDAVEEEDGSREVEKVVARKERINEIRCGVDRHRKEEAEAEGDRILEKHESGDHHVRDIFSILKVRLLAAKRREVLHGEPETEEEDDEE